MGFDKLKSIDPSMFAFIPEMDADFPRAVEIFEAKTSLPPGSIRVNEIMFRHVAATRTARSTFSPAPYTLHLLARNIWDYDLLTPEVVYSGYERLLIDYSEYMRALLPALALQREILEGSLRTVDAIVKRIDSDLEIMKSSVYNATSYLSNVTAILKFIYPILSLPDYVRIVRHLAGRGQEILIDVYNVKDVELRNLVTKPLLQIVKELDREIFRTDDVKTLLMTADIYVALARSGMGLIFIDETYAKSDLLDFSLGLLNDVKLNLGRMALEKVAFAIVFARWTYNRRPESGSLVKLMTHSLRIAIMIAKQRGSADQIVAALLRGLPNKTVVSVDDIRKFGDRVADIIKHVEIIAKAKKEEKLSWLEEKKLEIDAIAELSLDSLLVELADKLDNILVLKRDFEAKGEALWRELDAPKEMQERYYHSLLSAFERNPLSEQFSFLIRRFAVAIAAVFGEKGGPTGGSMAGRSGSTGSDTLPPDRWRTTAVDRIGSARNCHYSDQYVGEEPTFPDVEDLSLQSLALYTNEIASTAPAF